jgi:hypothetical protein
MFEPWWSPCHLRAMYQGVSRSITVTHSASPRKSLVSATSVKWVSSEPFFQAGHAGSIPVARSFVSLLVRTVFP